MNIEELAERRFYFEAERRRDLQASLSIPLGILTALFAALATMLSSLKLPFTLLAGLVLIISAAAASCGLVSVYYSVRAYWGYEYKHLPPLADLKGWWDGIIGLGYSPAEADEQLKILMMDRYIVAADHNSFNNNRKAGYLHKAGIWLVALLCLTILAGIPFAYLRMSEDETLKGARRSVTVQVSAGAAPNESSLSATPATPAAATAHTSRAASAGHPRKSGTARAQVSSQ